MNNENSMNESSESKRGLNRRDAMKGMTAVSLALAAASVGANFAIASPPGYSIPAPVVEEARKRARATGGNVTLAESPQQVTRDADVVYTDVWVSMGQENELATRLNCFPPFQVNADLVSLGAPDAIVMHCLPAHHFDYSQKWKYLGKEPSRHLFVFCRWSF